MTPNKHGYTDIEASELAAVSGVRIVDVRAPEELGGPLGRLPGSECVPLPELSERACWDKATRLLVVCRSGRRSAQAATVLAMLGYRHVLNLRGGLEACAAAGIPREHGPCPH